MLAKLEADRIEGGGAWLGDVRLSVGRSRPLVEQSLALPLELFGRLSVDSCLCRPVPNRSGVLKRPARTRCSGTGRTLLSTLALSRCATSSPNGGMTTVVDVGGRKDVVFGAAEKPRNAQGLLFRSLTVDAVAVLNNWASHKDLASAGPVLVQKSLQCDPTFSIFRIVGIGALEVEHKRENYGPVAPASSIRDQAAAFSASTTPRGNAAARSSRKRRTFAPSALTNGSSRPTPNRQRSHTAQSSRGLKMWRKNLVLRSGNFGG